MITLVFNIKAISVNKLYINIYGQRRRFISSEGKAFKKCVLTETTNQIISNIEYLKSLKNKKLDVNIEIASETWLLKDKVSIRKIDIQNQDKAVLDSVFDSFKSLSIDLDDSQIWKLSLNKVEGPDKITITIAEFAEKE